MYAPKITVTDVCKDRLHFYSNESAFYILEGSLCIANSALYFLAYRQVLSYRISANSFRGNYSFWEVGVRQLFKGGNYSKEETINFLLTKSMIKHA